LTSFPIPDTPGRMGRPPLDVKPMPVRLTAEAKQRIIDLVGKNRIAAFIREAIDNELKRREKPSQNRAPASAPSSVTPPSVKD